MAEKDVTQRNPKPWSTDQWNFIVFQADLSDSRSQKEYAEANGLQEPRLSEWKRLDGFWEAVQSLRLKATEPHMKGIYKAHVDKCLEGDVSAIKLMYQWRNELVEKSERTVRTPDKVTVTIEDADKA